MHSQSLIKVIEIDYVYSSADEQIREIAAKLEANGITTVVRDGLVFPMEDRRTRSQVVQFGISTAEHRETGMTEFPWILWQEYREIEVCEFATFPHDTNSLERPNYNQGKPILAAHHAGSLLTLDATDLWLAQADTNPPTQAFDSALPFRAQSLAQWPHPWRRS